ncbi:competence damage-inducible protein A [Agaricicola taiwanensis]|uniref:Competence damage-inducible protein A n=1 Tax=Agaricicola taiwanensis TaxID=591372 RepID=A0A8J2YII3_9RHOB|nr:CinA family protein [Agaricicola taiwanensis]GGE45418.1 competence damage-inducible protein A [Agaricicola taiwanensis]
MGELETTPITQDLLEQAAALLDLCQSHMVTLVTAESCTGGLVAAVLTDAPGASTVVEGGFVTYSNEAKMTTLGVPADLIERFGAVSEEVARAMASGALAHSQARLSVSITGIAGPGGGSEHKPIGLVHFATALGDEVRHRKVNFGDIGRGEVRRQSVKTALRMLEEHVRSLGDGDQARP